MVTKITTVAYGVVECYGKSTDEKPTDVGNSSRFYEMDTGDLYMFDEETKTWLKQ